jgi:hypothetical protein
MHQVPTNFLQHSKLLFEHLLLSWYRERKLGINLFGNLSIVDLNLFFSPKNLILDWVSV